MINLAALSSRELDALDAALTALDEALEDLLERGLIRESSGCDLEELSDAVAAEMEMREALYE